MLCHPHNPVGTNFSRDELVKLGEYIIERGLFICSDEIHCDLILGKDLHHISPASLTSKVAEKTITLMAPSKTFNIAGFGCSFAIISNYSFHSYIQSNIPKYSLNDVNFVSKNDSKIGFVEIDNNHFVEAQVV